MWNAFGTLTGKFRIKCTHPSPNSILPHCCGFRAHPLLHWRLQETHPWGNSAMAVVYHRTDCGANLLNHAPLGESIWIPSPSDLFFIFSIILDCVRLEFKTNQSYSSGPRSIVNNHLYNNSSKIPSWWQVFKEPAILESRTAGETGHVYL